MPPIPPPPDDPRKLAGAAPRASTVSGSIPPPPDDPSALAPAAPAPRNMVVRAWDALAVPEQKSREGLDAISRAVKRYYPSPETYGFEPTGNLPVDVALGTPKVLAESAAETMAKVAPSFISRGSMLASGAIKAAQMAAPAGRALARAAEGWSGLEYKNPGILQKAANDSSLIFAPGKDKAAALYEAATNRANVAPDIKEAMTHTDLVQKAKEALAAGTLTPDSALAARQSLDALRKTMPRGNYIELRDAFDSVAKNISAAADAAFSRGIKADALRGFLPVNKGGGTSIAKSAIGALTGKLGLPLMSPVVQGATATGIGAATRNIPEISAVAGPGREAANALIRRLQANKENR